MTIKILKEAFLRPYDCYLLEPKNANKAISLDYFALTVDSRHFVAIFDIASCNNDDMVS